MDKVCELSPAFTDGNSNVPAYGDKLVSRGFNQQHTEAMFKVIESLD
ncbi:hypothetical protein [Pseudoalteromonas rubra]|nr:hypothetical protein [Pseudoalteromonas rubra]